MSVGLSFLALLLAGPMGCVGERPRDGGGTAAPAERPANDGATSNELRRVYGLAEAVFVGQVDAADDGDAGTTYRVRPIEVLKAPSDAMTAGTTHPVDPAGELRVAEFLFRGEGQEASSIGPLAELSRYIFFLSRKERPGEWLNLADAATFRLPEAQATLDELRERKRKDDERRATLPPASPDAPPTSAPPSTSR